MQIYKYLGYAEPYNPTNNLQTNKNDTWVQMENDIVGIKIDDNFGTNVSISNDGKIVAISAPNGTTNNGINSGYVQLYRRGRWWSQIGSNINGILFGSSMSLSAGGNIVAIGSYINTLNTGHVKIFKYLNSEWGQIGADINGTSTGDEIGYSVDLSGDGKVVVIGSRYDTSVANSAHIKIYTYYDSVWTQIGSNIYDEGTSDTLGLSVSISHDGTIIAVGNPHAATNTGHVKLYKMKEYNTYPVEVPSNPVIGTSYFDSTNGILYIYNGTIWKTLTMT